MEKLDTNYQKRKKMRNFKSREEARTDLIERKEGRRGRERERKDERGRRGRENHRKLAVCCL